MFCYAVLARKPLQVSNPREVLLLFNAIIIRRMVYTKRSPYTYTKRAATRDQNHSGPSLSTCHYPLRSP